jgi:NodT family efflux transporter outer membrane factor (OMF) lipoprotein
MKNVKEAIATAISLRKRHVLRSSVTAGLVSCVIFLGACAVGQKYTKPSIEIPPTYKETAPIPGETEVNWKNAQPNDQAARGSWWEIFNDPQLNALEERVNVSNQSLKAAEAQFQQARALVRSNRAGYYPTITANPAVTAAHPSPNRSIRPATTASTFVDLVLSADVSYEPDLWGRVRRSVEGSVAEAQASAADLEAVRLSLQAEVASNYLTLRALDAEKQLLDSTVAAYEKALELTNNRYQSGVASGADIAQAQTQVHTTRAQAIDLGVQRAQVEHAVALLVGQPASTFSIPPAPATGPAPQVPVGLPSELLERRPDIAAAERRVASANAQIGVAKAAYFPSLILAASGGFETTHVATLVAWPSHFWSAGPALAQTLFDGGRRRALSEQAEAAYQATVAGYRQNALTAFQEVEDNLAAIRILTEEARVQDAATKAAQRSLALSMNRYRGGIVSYLEVITAQNAALANERTAVDILRRQMLASVLLVKAVGGGWSASTLPTSQDLISSNKGASVGKRNPDAGRSNP